jgi:hypothetical protein
MSKGETRRFPEPWVVQGNDSAFWIEDAAGNKFGYTYFREGNVPIGTGSNYLTRDEARRIVRNIAKLPELLKRSSD